MNRKQSIINGPYLLDPTATAITIAWETEEPVEQAIVYTHKGQQVKKKAAVYQREPVCQEYPQGCCLYT